MFQGRLNCISRVFEVTSKGISVKFHWYLKEEKCISREISGVQGYLKEIQWEFQGSFKGILRMFQGTFKGVPRKLLVLLPGRLKGVKVFLRGFQGC